MAHKRILFQLGEGTVCVDEEEGGAAEFHRAEDARTGNESENCCSAIVPTATGEARKTIGCRAPGRAAAFASACREAERSIRLGRIQVD